ncbi:immunoglobulin superfamily member 6-like [Perca flavescens]|uniref:immunoglobulin superfamily member 6-like n=1 Tax=Perca flavescens TaxID=8167 RepID=UPI00106E07C2|nr:immunoglobulin superfamily member 6-like [Perca flavescens]
MMSFTTVTASLLCSLSWISVSVSKSWNVEVQPGEDVTLLCSNFSSTPSQIYWFRAVQRSQPRCVSFMFEAPEPARLCDGFQNGKFEMTSDISTVFLKIKQVNSSDSGLYFCGYIITKNPVIVDATYLEVQAESDGTAKLMSLILGALTVLLLMVIIGLVVTIRKLQKAANEEQNPQQPENWASEELNYAAVAFRPKTRKTREVEPNVVYASTRWTQEATRKAV